MSTTLPPLPDHPEPRIMTWSELERQAIKAYGEACARAALAEAAQSLPDGWKLVPVDPTEAMLRAMSSSKATDEEGEFPSLFDLIDYSGENKTRAVMLAAYRAILAASPAQPRTRMWHDRIKDAHPNSDPQYWPNALKVEYMEREILDLRALVTQAKPEQAAQQWLPIETAPKDGTEIIMSNSKDVSAGSWFKGHDGTYDRDGAPNCDEKDACWIDWSGGMLPEPTHWMPLPSAPQPKD